MIFKPKSGRQILRIFCVVLLGLFAVTPNLFSADTNTAAAPIPASETDSLAAQDFLRSYLQLQVELRDTQLAIQNVRHETAQAAASNSAAVDERLRRVEKTIADQHTEQLNGIAHLGKTILIAAGSYAAIGIIGMIIAAFLQWAAINRLATAAANSAALRSSPALDAQGALGPPMHALEQSNTRLLELMDRLDQRIGHLEIAAKPMGALEQGSSFLGTDLEAQTETSTTPPKTSTVNVLISKSQTLLKLDRAEAALDCLEEALAIEPENPDAWVKKGAALEHLQRVPEAIDCYDRAIALDASMTMAYLHKGSLFTRLERHGEALACYEHALKSGKRAREEVMIAAK